MPPPRTEAETAAALMALWGKGGQIADLAVLDMAAARRIAARIRDARLAQGDRVAGRTGRGRADRAGAGRQGRGGPRVRARVRNGRQGACRSHARDIEC